MKLIFRAVADGGRFVGAPTQLDLHQTQLRVGDEK